MKATFTILLVLALALGVGSSPGAAGLKPAKKKTVAGELFFPGPVTRLQIEISPEGMETLRQYNQVWGKPRPERHDVQAIVREGSQVYSNVSVHLKGSYSFQPIDSKPSFTLKFDAVNADQKFHGLTKIHLNNSVQDPTYLSEKLARELFEAADVPAPRAGHAMVDLNGRPVGLFVLIEGWNKQFLKHHFSSPKGNLYDGGSGGDVTKALKMDSSENPEDRTDLTNLVKAVKEPDPAKRLARIGQVLDVDRFISFAATEIIMCNWDGYSIGGPNNYRVYHDPERNKMVFMPHGLDQLFGVGSSPSASITPHFTGIVASGLLSIPEMRARYLARMGEILTNNFRLSDLNKRIDIIAAPIRLALASDLRSLAEFEGSIQGFKSRIAARLESVQQQLQHPEQPLRFGSDDVASLSGWRFKSGLTKSASGRRVREENRDVLQVFARSGNDSVGGWRANGLLAEGHYIFSGRARADGLGDNASKTNGVILRVSGERSPKGLSRNAEWTTMNYEFDVRGIMDVEFVCEFRGAQGSGSFDMQSLKVMRKGPPAVLPVKEE
ncbi:MAG TPA: CotH kinase family protein [Verrucomicrobiae bacterium]